jgi:PAS domain S-box-containing protein
MKKDSPSRKIDSLKSLSNIADRVPAMIVIYSIKTGKYIYVNDSIKNLLGYKKEDFLKKGLPFVGSLVHPDDISLITEQNQKALIKANSKKYGRKMDETILTFEYRMKHKNGNWIWLHSDGIVFDRDQKGQVEHVMNISVDITKRKEAELQAKNEKIQAEERYRTFLAQSSEAIWRFELEKPIPLNTPAKKQLKLFYKYAYLAECNDALAKMYGYTKSSDLVGARLGDFLIESDPKNIEYLKNFIASHYRLENAESHETDKDGNEKFFVNNLIGITEDGMLKRAWGTQSDITERKKADRMIKESEERLRLALDAGQIGVWDWDVLVNKINWTREVHQIHGLDYGDFSGSIKEYEKLIHPEDRDLVRHELAEALKGNKLYQMEFRIIRPSGEVRWLSTKAQVIFSGKKPIRMLGATVDITGRKKLERQKDEFIAIASHELKTPVTSLKAFNQFLINKFEKENDPVSKTLLTKMDNQLVRLTKLIVDLLDSTKIESGNLKLQKDYFDFNKLVEEVTEEMQRISISHKIRKTLSTNKIRIFGDRDRLEQVLTNLISNAIKYSPHSKSIVVKTYLNGKFLKVSVKDFGLGIPKDQKDRVFERFFRISDKGKESYPGLGLGLFISSEIIRRHGGTIIVDSASGKGSTFTFTLPISKVH